MTYFNGFFGVVSERKYLLVPSVFTYFLVLSILTYFLITEGVFTLPKRWVASNTYVVVKSAKTCLNLTMNFELTEDFSNSLVSYVVLINCLYFLRKWIGTSPSG